MILWTFCWKMELTNHSQHMIAADRRGVPFCLVLTEFVGWNVNLYYDQRFADRWQMSASASNNELQWAAGSPHWNWCLNTPEKDNSLSMLTKLKSGDNVQMMYADKYAHIVYYWIGRQYQLVYTGCAQPCELTATGGVSSATNRITIT